jgi:porin
VKKTHALLAAASLVAASPLALAEDKPAAAPAGEKQPELTAQVESKAAGSSDNINYELDTARPRPAGILKHGPVSLIDPYIDDLNAFTKKKMGLEFGFAYTGAWQRTSDGDIKDAATADMDAFVRWRAFGAADSGWRGVFGANGEYRDVYGSYSVKELGDSLGSQWRTVNGYGEQDPALIQCWWEQHLFDDVLIATVGKLDPDNYYNTNRYQSDSTAFMSKSFSANPARAHPSNGLGANLKAMLGCDWYMSTGIHDANADKIHSGFSRMDEHEYFTAGEIGYTPTFENMGKGAYRLEVWRVDNRAEDGYPEDHGVALSTEQEIGGGVVPFFRAAWSQGDVTGVERFANAGVGLEGVLRGKSDLTGIGIAWGEPSDESLHDQWGGEVFHRFQLSPDVQLTLGYQYILRPTYDTVDGDDPIGVVEVRVRISF